MLKAKSISLGLLLTLGFVWGTGYSIARFAMTHGVSPLGYSFWQCLGPAVLLSLLTVARQRGPTSRTVMTVSHLRYYLICAITGVVIPNTNMYFAAPHLPAGILAVVVNTVPVIAYPLALLARQETFSLVRFLGVCCAVIGLMLMVIPKASLPSTDAIPWILSVLITPFSFACCSVYIARYRPAQTDSVSLSAGTLIFAAIFITPLVLLQHSFYLFHFPLSIADGVIILEILLSSLGYYLFFQLIKIAGPVYYSLVDTIVSLTGLMWGYVIFHEQLNQWTTPAILFILLALFLVTQQQLRWGAKVDRYFSQKDEMKSINSETPC